MASITLIGDLIGSRTAPDRSDLHRRLGEAIAGLNATLAPTTPLRITVGDEYQGTFAVLGDALRASLLLRLALLPDHDVRHGVGFGEVEVLTEAPRVEDGPGWWAARDAIEQVETGEGRAASRLLRTAYVVAGGATAAPDPAPVNAALVLRDQLVGGLSRRSLSGLGDLLEGRAQRDIAEELGISPSAVSQRVRADGLAAVVAAHELMGGVR